MFGFTNSLGFPKRMAKQNIKDQAQREYDDRVQDDKRVGIRNAQYRESDRYMKKAQVRNLARTHEHRTKEALDKRRDR